MKPIAFQVKPMGLHVKPMGLHINIFGITCEYCMGQHAECKTFQIRVCSPSLDLCLIGSNVFIENVLRNVCVHSLGGMCNN